MTQYSKTQLVDKSGHIDIYLWQEWQHFKRGCCNNVIDVENRVISFGYVKYLMVFSLSCNTGTL